VPRGRARIARKDQNFLMFDAADDASPGRFCPSAIDLAHSCGDHRQPATRHAVRGEPRQVIRTADRHIYVVTSRCRRKFVEGRTGWAGRTKNLNRKGRFRD
jgi:hypothetical protein